MTPSELRTHETVVATVPLPAGWRIYRSSIDEDGQRHLEEPAPVAALVQVEQWRCRHPIGHCPRECASRLDATTCWFPLWAAGFCYIGDGVDYVTENFMIAGPGEEADLGRIRKALGIGPYAEVQRRPLTLAEGAP